MSISIPEHVGPRVALADIDSRQTPLDQARRGEGAVASAFIQAGNQATGTGLATFNTATRMRQQDDAIHARDAMHNFTLKVNEHNAQLLTTTGKQSMPSPDQDDPNAFPGVTVDATRNAKKIYEESIEGLTDAQKKLTVSPFQSQVESISGTMSKHEAAQRLVAKAESDNAEIDQVQARAEDSFASIDDVLVHLVDLRNIVYAEPGLSPDGKDAKAEGITSEVLHEVITRTSREDPGEAMILVDQFREELGAKYARLLTVTEGKVALGGGRRNAETALEQWKGNGGEMTQAQVVAMAVGLSTSEPERRAATKLVKATIEAADAAAKKLQTEDSVALHTNIRDQIADGEHDKAREAVLEATGIVLPKFQDTMEKLIDDHEAAVPPPPVDYGEVIELKRLARSSDKKDKQQFIDSFHTFAKYDDGSVGGGQMGVLMKMWNKVSNKEPIQTEQGRSYDAILTDGGNALAAMKGLSGVNDANEKSILFNDLGREFDEAIAYEVSKQGGLELTSLQLTEVMDTMLFVNKSYVAQWLTLGDKDIETRNLDFDGDITSIDVELIKSPDHIPYQIERSIRAKIHGAKGVATDEYIMKMFRARHGNAVKAKEIAVEAAAAKALQDAIATHAPGQP